MITLDKTKQQKIHNRKIDTAIYEGASDTIIVEGSLQDQRFCDSYLFSGEVRPPYTVHHMIIRMELQLPELTILEIEVKMPTVPHNVCLETQACLAPLKGLRIAAGFTSKVRKLIYRKKACTHLQTLVTAMAPAAFQGAWSARIRKPLDPDVYVDMMIKLKNTCWTWREDGQLVEKLKIHE
ncbi:MAG: DUF2889 domain-containing protein [Desulfosarcina sp.]